MKTSIRRIARWGRILTGLLVIVITAESRGQITDPSELQSQVWYGVLDAESRHFRFILRLARSDGSWTGELQSLDEGNAVFPLDRIVTNEHSLEFELNSTGAVYRATREQGERIAKGSWQQRGVELALEFEQVDAPPKQEYTAVWSGTIGALFQKLEVRIRELSTGEVYFDSLSQLAGGFVTEKSITDEGVVTFEVPAVQGTFEGKLSEDGEQLEGYWKQGLFSLKLVLNRVHEEINDIPPEKPNRPQTPEPPFPYDVDEIEFVNPGANIKLAGTLTIPRSDGEPQAWPAVVLISGSGPQDRDETIADHKPFWVIADYLTRHGIAVLRFDDRGVGDSEGDFDTATSLDFASDVSAAVAFLRSDARIDSTKIGLCGHSEGGLIAPLVARDEDVAFVVMLAGPGVNGGRIATSQTRLILEASGTPADEVERQLKIQRVFIDLSNSDPDLDKDAFAAQASAAIVPLLTEEERGQDNAQQLSEAAADKLLSPWFQFFMKHEPGPVLEQMRCPVLALVGEKDLQVDPQLNLPPIRAALEAAPTTDFEVLELPRLNHLFQECETGLLQEYAEIEQTVAPEALQKMADWIQDHTK